jgi:hypothetical protein
MSKRIRKRAPLWFIEKHVIDAGLSYDWNL